jgi:hypothetical protein
MNFDKKDCEKLLNCLVCLSYDCVWSSYNQIFGCGAVRGDQEGAYYYPGTGCPKEPDEPSFSSNSTAQKISEGIADYERLKKQLIGIIIVNILITLFLLSKVIRYNPWKISKKRGTYWRGRAPRVNADTVAYFRGAGEMVRLDGAL